MEDDFNPVTVEVRILDDAGNHMLDAPAVIGRTGELLYTLNGGDSESFTLNSKSEFVTGSIVHRSLSWCIFNNFNFLTLFRYYCVHSVNSKGLVFNYREGRLQNGKIAGPRLFGPPLSMAKCQASVEKLPQNFFCPPPFSMAKEQGSCSIPSMEATVSHLL